MASLRSRSLAVVATLALATSGLLAACGSGDSGSTQKDDGATTTQEAATVETTTQEAATVETTTATSQDKSDDAVGMDNHTIVFEVTSTTATTADITITSLDANGNISQEHKTDEPLPYTQTVELDGSIVFDPTNANMLAQAKDGTDITATITIDDNAPVTSTADGQFATVMVAGAN